MRLMSPLDQAMMTGEVVASSLHVAALLVFTPPPDAGPDFVDRLYEDGLVGGAEIDELFRQQPYTGADTMGLWGWRSVNVDPAEHVERRWLAPGSDDTELWQLVAELHAIPLKRDRPLWTGYLIEGLPGGRFAFYVKVHHALMDGISGMKQIADSLSTDPDDRTARPFYAVRQQSIPARRRKTGPLTALRDSMSLVKDTFDLGYDLLGGQVAKLHGAFHGEATIQVAAPYTRFNGRLGAERSVAGVALELHRLRALGAVAGVTVNDVLMAVVAGAIREWLAARDELPSLPLVAITPISVRAGGPTELADQANLFGVDLCSLATDIADPAARLMAIHRAMDGNKRRIRDYGSAASLLLTAPSIAYSMLVSLLPFGPKWITGYNLPISTIRGPESTAYYGGARLDGLYPISTVFDGLGLNATVYSTADHASVGYVAGRDMMPDIETMIPLTEQALAELEEAFGVTPGA